ncbi:MAG: ABC transporter ATP-binding protein [Ilumatobacteraceae bacterium]
MSSLHLDQLSVRYGKREALAPVTERVESGEWLGLIGPNGAGKSSLLRAIAGLVAVTGEVYVDDCALSPMPDRDRATRVAYVAQNPLIPDDMTAFDYILLGRTPYITYFGTDSSRDRDVVGDVIERLRLTEYAPRMLGSMSGGERQRVVLARALAQEAPVLLLDEPTSALDIGHQQQALELVTELREHSGLTVVSAMHDLTLAGTYTDRLVMLDEGAVVARGPAEEVLTAERLGAVFNVCVTVEVDPDDGVVIVTPRRGFPAGT